MIIFKHEETEKLHIYSLRSFAVAFWIVVLFLPFVFLSMFTPDNSIKLIGVLGSYGIALLVALDALPMTYKYYVARFRGKSVKQSGRFMSSRVEIEK